MTRIAVVLLNLGGPESPEAVRPFLFNLFSDRAIIGLPQPLRWLVATLIAWRRAPVARAIYAKIGGASPLLANTEAQARALEAVLGAGFRTFIAMRYWPPRSDAAARAVREWRPDEVVVLPLYPQASTTTTQSSLSDWRRAAKAAGLSAPERGVCCYPDEAGFIAALAAEVRAELAEWPAEVPKRLLFSAHGLPQKIVAGGDPYQWQVERTAEALKAALGVKGLDCVTCYQSRVGPLAWIGPATDDEIRRAGRDGVGLIVVPVAFVSEHSETLVELDIEYRHLAESAGVPRYRRVATAGAAPDFIAGLARLVRAAQPGPRPAGGARLCPAAFACCLCAAGEGGGR